jgi:GNAT superfamily N-acetyltransferase
MWWRISRKQFESNGNEGNRQAMYNIVHSGEVPGILAYHGDKAIGWCSVAPRECFASLNRSPVLRRIDGQPVWSIVCFYIAKAYRHQGVTHALIQAAIDYAREQGGTIIEAYPTIPKDGQLAPTSSFMGLPSVFQKAGFVECARPSKRKMIMRYKPGSADIPVGTRPDRL